MKPRAARRKAMRGAAMIESLLVIGLLTVFLYGVQRLYRWYYASWSVVQEARADAWTVALAGCPASEDMKHVFDHAKDDASNSEEDDEEGDEEQLLGLNVNQPESIPTWFRIPGTNGAAYQQSLSKVITSPPQPATGKGPDGTWVTATPATDAVSALTRDTTVQAYKAFPCNEIRNREDLTIRGTGIVGGIISAGKELLKLW